LKKGKRIKVKGQDTGYWILDTGYWILGKTIKNRGLGRKVNIKVTKVS